MDTLSQPFSPRNMARGITLLGAEHEKNHFYRESNNYLGIMAELWALKELRINRHSLVGFKLHTLVGWWASGMN